MSKNKSLLETALMDTKHLENAFVSLGKEMLSQTMKLDLEEMLKESLEKEAENEKELAEVEDKEELEKVDDQEEIGDDLEMSDDMDDDMDMSDNEDDMDMSDDMDEIEPADDMDISDDEFDMDMSNEMDDFDSDDDMVDLTNVSDEELITIFKKMKPEDGIIVKKDGDKVHIKDEDNEYLVSMNENEMMDEDFMNEDEDFMEYDEMMDEDEDLFLDVDRYRAEKDMTDDDYAMNISDDDDDMEMSDDNDMDDEIVFEIEMDEDDQMLMNDEDDEDAMEEASYRTFQNGRNQTKKPENFPASRRGGRDLNETIKKLVNKLSLFENEIKVLRTKNEQYKQALNVWKKNLNELNILKTNLVNTNKLFTENVTTKEEKLRILNKFDKVKTIEESNNLFESINNNLKNRTAKNLNEQIDEKLGTLKGSSASKLIENTLVEDESIKRMRELNKFLTSK